MNIHVGNINNGFIKEFHLDGIINLPESLAYNENVYVKVEGVITNSYGKYTLKGKIFAKIQFNCNSCLKEFEKDIQIDMLEIFSKVDENDDEIWVFHNKDDIINLEDPIKTNILVNIPMKALCSNNCKGLCCLCGHNLNEGNCSCNRDFIDPRFEKFLHLFKENNKGV